MRLRKGVARDIWKDSERSIKMPETQFRDWDKVISVFIRNTQRSKVKFETLQFEKQRSGLSLPNFSEYFHEAWIIPGIYWTLKRNGKVLSEK